MNSLTSIPRYLQVNCTEGAERVRPNLATTSYMRLFKLAKVQSQSQEFYPEYQYGVSPFTQQITSRKSVFSRVETPHNAEESPRGIVQRERRLLCQQEPSFLFFSSVSPLPCLAV
ncbi:hypothetical protein MAP00_004673 [Monascus purpureus]|nr:hypothetical protein MAP00_004673 [Monascus purpureus]